MYKAAEDPTEQKTEAPPVIGEASRRTWVRGAESLSAAVMRAPVVTAPSALMDGTRNRSTAPSRLRACRAKLVLLPTIAVPSLTIQKVSLLRRT